MDYQRIHWDNLSDESNQVILVEGISSQVLEDVSREEMMKVEKYVTLPSNKYGPTGSVTIYTIIERAIDSKNNLILFVESDFVQYNR